MDRDREKAEIQARLDRCRKLAKDFPEEPTAEHIKELEQELLDNLRLRSGNNKKALGFYVPMPRYFFHVFHERHEPDKEGEELPDRQAAWKEATETAGQILQDLDGKLKPERDWRMEVTDEFQNTLYVLHISAEKPK